jgi:hypothetical protein
MEPYLHVEVCPDCEQEVEYSTPDPYVAVRCPTEDCNHFHIHCDACIHGEVPWSEHDVVGHFPDCSNCFWTEEACPHSGEMVPVHRSATGEWPCACCGEPVTKEAYENSWE